MELRPTSGLVFTESIKDHPRLTLAKARKPRPKCNVSNERTPPKSISGKPGDEVAKPREQRPPKTKFRINVGDAGAAAPRIKTNEDRIPAGCRGGSPCRGVAGQSPCEQQSPEGACATERGPGPIARSAIHRRSRCPGRRPGGTAAIQRMKNPRKTLNTSCGTLAPFSPANASSS